MTSFRTVLSFVMVAVTLGATEPPRITAVTPSAPVASPKPQLMTVAGAGFAAGLTFEVTSQGNTEVLSGRDIQSLGNTSFEASVVLAQAGTVSLVVRNTDGGLSAAFALPVAAAQAGPQAPPPTTPAIERVSPETATKGGVAQTVTLSGRNFSPELTVTITDPTGTVTVVKGTSLGAVTSTRVQVSVVLDVAGDYTFTVTNPPGQASNTVTVVVS